MHLGSEARPPLAAHKQLTWRLARAALQRAEQQQWRLLENPARLRLQTIDSLCQRISQDQPLLSQLGAACRAEDNAARLYRQAADSLLSDLAGGGASGAVAEMLRHVDNNVDKLRQLLIEMLPLRDQWLDYVAAYRAEEDKRKLLEAVLERWIAQELNTLIDELQPFASDLCLCAAFAAGQLKDEVTDSAAAIATLFDCQSLPATEGAGLLQWQGILSLLLTEKGDLRRSINKKQGFPAKSSAEDSATAAEYQLHKEKMQSLLQNMAVSESLLRRLRLVSSLPLKGYQRWHWKILEPMTQCLLQAYAQLRVIFAQEGRCDHVEVMLSALRALSLESGSDEAEATRYQWDQNLRHILVDEFQDTSVQQFKLLKLLTAEWSQENLHLSLIHI